MTYRSTHSRSGPRGLTGRMLLLLGLLALAGCEGQNGAGQQAADSKSAGTPQAEAPAVNQQDTTAAQNWSEPQAAPEPSCANCGTISAVEPVAKKGEASGIGVVAGGVAGGIIGNQIGGGTGKKIATVAGAVGGALAGNEIEKYINAEKYYAVTVDMASGGTQTVKIANGENLSVGQKVKVDGNNLYLQ